MSSFKRFCNQSRLLLHSVPASLVALLVASVIAMNLLANKSIVLPVDWLALDCGIIVSWAIFLVMDIVTRRFGVRAANTLSVVALVVNLLVSVLFLLASLIPGEWSQSYVEGSETLLNGALDATFANSWFVILGSSTAFLASCIINNCLHYAIAKAIGKQNFVAFSISSYVSTFVAQFADNLLFAFIVSLHFFGWTPLQCVTCALTGAVCELLCEVVFSPIGYRVAKRLEEENVGAAYLEALAQDKKEAV